jgi:hypothetical protein
MKQLTERERKIRDVARAVWFCVGVVAGMVPGQEPMRVVEVKPGLYVVKNAYLGRYEYFKGRPLPKVVFYENETV